MGLGLNGAILHIICTLMPDKHPLLIVENSINKVVFIFLHKFLGIICFFHNKYSTFIDEYNLKFK
jgi:hypothetical protein